MTECKGINSLKPSDLSFIKEGQGSQQSVVSATVLSEVNLVDCPGPGSWLPGAGVEIQEGPLS